VLAHQPQVIAPRYPASSAIFTDPDPEPTAAAPVRSAGKIAVTFTTRQFKTPLREEYAGQEEEVILLFNPAHCFDARAFSHLSGYFAKQRPGKLSIEPRREFPVTLIATLSCYVIAESKIDLRKKPCPDDREFFKHGDFQSAINAFTEAGVASLPFPFPAHLELATHYQSPSTPAMHHHTPTAPPAI
jgi:hypothetical protein